MKKVTILLSVFLLIAISNNGMAQVNKKVAKARAELEKATENLKIAKSDSASDFNLYKAAAEKSIAENKIKIADLKAKSPNDNSIKADEYDTKVLDLEQKNNDLKRRIDEAKYTKQTTWIQFKNEFKHDMDELGVAIENVFKR